MKKSKKSSTRSSKTTKNTKLSKKGFLSRLSRPVLFALVFGIVGLAGLITSFALSSPSVTYTAVEDSHIHAAEPGKNFGGSLMMYVRKQGGNCTSAEQQCTAARHLGHEQTYLKFNVGAVPSGKRISKVVLRMKTGLEPVSASPDGGNVFVAKNNNWSENTLTWDNAPGAQTNQLASFGSVGNKKWYEVQLDAVKQPVTGAGTYSFVLTSNDRDRSGWWSKETENKPQLLVYYEDIPANPSSNFELKLSWFQANTGPRVAPTKTHDRNFTAADAGKTFDGYTFSNGISANGVDNVTIRNAIITGPVTMGYGDASGWKFEYVDVDGRSGPFNNQALIGNDGFSFYRSNIHHGSNGIRWQGTVSVTESWVHDMYEDAEGSHRSCIGTNGSTQLGTFTRNWIDCSANIDGLSGTFVMYGDFGPVQNVTVEGNYLNGSGSFTTYAGSCGTKNYPNGTNIKYINNVFGPSKQYGYRSCWDNNPESRGGVWSGNVDPSGKTVN